MENIHDWEAKRAGARITVRGKAEALMGGPAPSADRAITGVMSIKPRDGDVIATLDDGTEYRLMVPAKAEF